MNERRTEKKKIERQKNGAHPCFIFSGEDRTVCM